ncbi:MAG: DMT family transporter [FCB group bacterium]|nr:DMT family transporter [FCB group bacterium]
MPAPARPQSTRLRGDMWAVVSAVATGGGFIAAKAALQTLPPITFNAYMFGIGMLAVVVDAVISRKVAVMLKVSFRQLAFLFIVAILFCGAVFCLNTALAQSEPATVSFLSRIELVSTLLLAAIFLKERISKSEIIGLLIVTAGIVVMRYDASVELSRTVMLITIGSFMFGAGEVLIKSKIDWMDYRTFIFYRNLFMSVIFFIISSLWGKWVWVDDGNLMMVLIVAGIVLPYLGRLGYLKAMQNIDISRASIIVQSQPFFAAATALAILGTFPPFKEVIGGLLIVAGVVTIKLLEKKTARV